MEDKIPVCPREGRGSHHLTLGIISPDMKLQSPRGARIASGLDGNYNLFDKWELQSP